MQFQATLRYARTTARKCGLVATMVRGRNVNDALEILKVTPKRPARYLHKLVQSAMANATQMNQEKDLGVDLDGLFIREIRVGGGPIMKRWGMAPMGRGVMIKRRTTHMTIILEARPKAVKKAKAAKTVAAAKPAGTAPATAALESNPAPSAAPKAEEKK